MTSWTSALPLHRAAFAQVFELYAAGKENGVVLGCGEQSTYAVLVHEGLPDPRTQLRSAVAGEALTAWTAKLLSECGGGASFDEGTCRAIKEAVGLVSPQPCAESASRERQQGQQRDFALPDGKVIRRAR